MALTPTITLIMNVVVYTTMYLIQFAGSPLAHFTALDRAYGSFTTRNQEWLLNFARWILIHLIYLAHWVLCLSQLPFQFLNVLYSAAAFWPRFYIKLFGPSSAGRSIWAILCNPEGDPPSKRARKRFVQQKELSDCYISVRPTNAKLNDVLTSYQVGGSHAHLASSLNQQVSHGITAARNSATVFPYFDDPFKLSVAYAYVAKSIKEPPDCALQYLWAIFWHFFWAFHYVLKGYCKLKYSLDSKYIAQLFGQDLPDLTTSTDNFEVHCFATGGEPNKEIISFDSDGIPFIVDSGAVIVR